MKSEAINSWEEYFLIIQKYRKDWNFVGIISKILEILIEERIMNLDEGWIVSGPRGEIYNPWVLNLKRNHIYFSSEEYAKEYIEEMKRFYGVKKEFKITYHSNLQ